jgi:hypothetical protein
VQYSESTIQKLGVNPASWDWYTKDYSKHTEKQQPAPKKPKVEGDGFMPVIFAIAFVLFLGYAAAFLHPWFTSGTFPTVSAIGGAVVLLGIVFCVFGILIPGLIIVGLALALAVLNFFTGHIAEGFLFLGAIVVGFASVYMFLLSFPTAPRKEPKYASIDMSNQGQRVYGKPGGVGNAVSKFGTDAVNAGVAGEMSTAALLDLLLKIPGVTVYHGLKFPDSDTADVDHAVVHGRRVFLIDSKQYRSGDYHWGKEYDRAKNLTLNGWEDHETIEGGGHRIKNYMSVAHKGFQEMLGRKVNLSSIVLIHGKDIKIGSPSTSPGGVKLCTADDAMRLIGDSLALNLFAWKDDMTVRSTMRDQLK